MSELRNNPGTYADEAHTRMVDLYLAVSQRTLRQTNDEDREDYFRAREAEEIGVLKLQSGARLHQEGAGQTQRTVVWGRPSA